MRPPLSGCSGSFLLSSSKSSTVAVALVQPLHQFDSKIYLSALRVVVFATTTTATSSTNEIGSEISSYHLDSDVPIATAATFAGRTSFWKKYSRLRKGNAGLGSNSALSASIDSFNSVSYYCCSNSPASKVVLDELVVTFILHLTFPKLSSWIFLRIV